MAVATFGEGYHNFHHIFANDYRNGVRWYHWDPTKWMIAFFTWIGGAHSLRRTPWSEILKAQMRMDEKLMKDRFQGRWQIQFQTQLDTIKQQVELAQARFEQLRDEYRKYARVYKKSSLDRLKEIRAQVAFARREFKIARAQWRNYKLYLMSVPVPAIAG
jgi:stearoyl-CoA desaturase (delta-9 desaturase)